MQKSFFGYRRDNGRVGIRNHVLILPLDDLSQPACNAVANNIGGTVAIQHPYGRLQFGADLDLHFRTLIGAGSNPNVAAVIVIGIEEKWTQDVVDGIAKTGKPVILMQNGKILERNLQRTRVNLDELTMHLREKGIFDLSTVKFAILETNGQLSTLLYAKEQPASARDAGIRVRETELPVTIISAGRILAENLHLAGRDGGWLEAELKRRSLTAEQVLLLTIDAAGTVYLVRKEDLA